MARKKIKMGQPKFYYHDHFVRSLRRAGLKHCGQGIPTHTRGIAGGEGKHSRSGVAERAHSYLPMGNIVDLRATGTNQHPYA